MPEISIWSLCIALAVLAFGLTLKIADMRRSVKNLQKELDTARSELKETNEKNNKRITDIQELSDRRINELTEKTSDLQKQLTEKDSNQDDIKNGVVWEPLDPEAGY